MTYAYQSIYLDNPIVTGRCMDIMRPSSKGQEKPALFFVHGGGWKAGSRLSFHPIIRAFNSEGHVCASTDYRLVGGGVTAFHQLMDIRHAYQYFQTSLKELGHSGATVVLGSSAGAHLAALLSLAKPGACGDDEHFHDWKPQPWNPPIGVILQATPVLFEPWEDIFPPIWSSMQSAAGVSYHNAPETYQRLAPINYISPDSCPCYFMEAECEHMFPLRYIKDFVEKMHRLGRRADYKVYRNAEHGFFYDVTRRVQKEAFEDCLGFINSLGQV